VERRTWLNRGVVAAGALVASSILAVSGATRPTLPTRCPTALAADPGTIDQAISAARRLFIIGHTTHAQGRTFRLTVRDDPVIAAVLVSATWAGSPVPNAEQVRRAAVRRCGRRTANASWLVVVNIPQVLLAQNSLRPVVIVRTPSGWRSY
jgi:hypothetical protein